MNHPCQVRRRAVRILLSRRFGPFTLNTPVNPHPGTNEIEWLASLKTVAEAIGEQVFGRRIRWRVEPGLSNIRDRSDVVVEFDDGTKIITGEAKRPNDPHGVTPLDISEVNGAISKAQHQGCPICFTTNFHQIALFDAGPGYMARPLSRLQGQVIEFIPRELANAIGWWSVLDDDQRAEAVASGLRALFERCRLVQEGTRPRVPVDLVVVDFFSQITHQLLGPSWQAFLRAGARNVPEIRQRALTSALDPDDDQQCQYLIAQSIFEVLSAALFCRVLQDHFSTLGSLLAGTDPSSPKQLENTIIESLQEAESRSGDYNAILNLSPTGRWVLANAPLELLPHWKALFAFVEQLDLAEISSDVLGSIFERLISPDRRHEMGQHYTQPRLARAMAEWGVVSRTTTVLDPSCGAGTFLVETYAQHKRLGLSHDEALAQTYGNDVDTFAVHLAAINLATKRIRKGQNHPQIRLGDAFDLAPGLPMVRVQTHGQPVVETTFHAVDLVIANPPYARSHSDPVAALERIQRLHGTSGRLPETTGINLGAWFVLLGAGLLQEGGRMAFVLPSAVLQNDNLGRWRQWIRQRWDIVIWHTEDDVWFSDARVATCVILFTPKQTTEGLGRVTFVNVLEPASASLHDVSGVPSPAARVSVRDISGVAATDDLLVPGTVPNVLQSFANAPNVSSLGDLHDVEVGAGQKLGHDFFKLKDRSPGNPAVLRELEGLGTAIRVNRSHLTPILSSPKELTNGEPTLTGNWLLTLPQVLPGSRAIREYIAYGKSQGVHEAPSIQARGKAWWSISPRRWDLAIPMNAQFRHDMAWLNPPGAVTNNFNAVRVSEQEHALLIGASISSAFGALARLFISGEVGCEGARRLLLSQFVHWPVLDPHKVRDAKIRSECLEAYEHWRQIDTSEIDEMSLADTTIWRRLTVAVARAALGASALVEEAEQLADAAIDAAHATVSRRRRREASAIGGRTRQSSSRGNSLSARARHWIAKSPEFASVVELLTIGPKVYRLRHREQLETLELFGETTPLAVAPEEERILVDFLGGGFEAAWPDPHVQGALSKLTRVLAELYATATRALIAEPPAVDSAARVTWDQLAEELREHLRRQLQSAVRMELA